MFLCFLIESFFFFRLNQSKKITTKTLHVEKNRKKEDLVVEFD
jgi:hypothetical protein